MRPSVGDAFVVKGDLFAEHLLQLGQGHLPALGHADLQGGGGRFQFVELPIERLAQGLKLVVGVVVLGIVCQQSLGHAPVLERHALGGLFNCCLLRGDRRQVRPGHDLGENHGRRRPRSLRFDTGDGG